MDINSTKASISNRKAIKATGRDYGSHTQVNTDSLIMNKDSLVPATMPDTMVANTGVFVFLFMRERERKSKPSSAIA